MVTIDPDPTPRRLDIGSCLIDPCNQVSHRHPRCALLPDAGSTDRPSLVTTDTNFSKGNYIPETHPPYLSYPADRGNLALTSPPGPHVEVAWPVFVNEQPHKHGSTHQRAERTARAVDRMNLTG
ncbi:hypothetical protein Isolate57596_42750 [Mycobacteroides abscessus subsp. abscessus]